LAEVVGAAEADVDFTPDLLENLRLRVLGHEIGGRYFKQVYRPTTGKAVGNYTDGSVAAVENHFGKGRTILIGTFPGAAYFKKPNSEARSFFQSLLDGKQRLTVSDNAVQARLHEGSGGTVLWVVNPSRGSKSVSVKLAAGNWRTGKDIWANTTPEVSGGEVRVTIPERDGAVIRLGN
jgi:beta-galactosidase